MRSQKWKYTQICTLMVTVEKFEEAMTAEEKAKMYEAIGYHEGQGDPTLPMEVTN